MTEVISVRKFCEADRPLVLNSWVKSWIAANRVEPERVYGESQRVHRDAIRKVNAESVLVAHLPGDPDQILGWICAHENQCAYVYVKHLFRGRGIATQLRQASGLSIDLRAIVSTNYFRHRSKERLEP